MTSHGIEIADLLRETTGHAAPLTGKGRGSADGGEFSPPSSVVYIAGLPMRRVLRQAWETPQGKAERLRSERQFKEARDTCVKLAIASALFAALFHVFTGGQF